MKHIRKVIDNIKSIFAIIAKSKYKWWLIMLLVFAIAFACLSVFLTDSKFAEVLLMGILVSLFINLVSSFVTIIFIEERDQNAILQIEATKQAVVVDKLIQAIREYNLFFANLYKATSISITDVEQRSKNIYYETDIFVQQLNKIDFYKEGYMGHYQMQNCYTWDQIFGYVSEMYNKSMREIQDNYLFCLSSIVLIEPIKKIVDLSSGASKLNIFRQPNFSLNQMTPKDAGKCILYPDGIEIKVPYLILNTLDTIAYTTKLMIEVDRLTRQSNFIIPTNTFLAPNDAPHIGSGIDDNYARTLAT